MTTIEQIKAELEQRIAFNATVSEAESIYEYTSQTLQADRALLQMIKDMEALVALGDRERHKAVGDKAAESLQTLCNNWGK